MTRPIFEELRVEVYMDNAATTMMDDEVVAAMQPFLEEKYGNPESPHHLGREAAEAVEEAREHVARLMDVTADTVHFTSGGTESNNWALKGVNLPDDRRRAIVTAIEHPSVLEPLDWLLEKGLVSAFAAAPVTSDGVVDLEYMEQELNRDDVGLVSVQHANNEVGTIQPVEKIYDLCYKDGCTVPFHVDAIQTFGKIPLHVMDIGADLVSVSAHKIHGPMGIGALFIKPGTDIDPLLHGGGHEKGMRSGTLAVPAIVGFGRAAEMAWSNLRSEQDRQMNMVAYLAKELATRFGAKVNGHISHRLPGLLSFTLPDVESSMVAALLNSMHGICVGYGSACGSHKKGSHVLDAMGRDLDYSQRTLRVSLSRFNTERHARMLVSCLQSAIKEARERGLD